jgi:hypothetical protein
MSQCALLAPASYLVYVFPEGGKGFGNAVVATHAKFDVTFFPARRNNQRVHDSFATLSARLLFFQSSIVDRRLCRDCCRLSLAYAAPVLARPRWRTLGLRRRFDDRMCCLLTAHFFKMRACRSSTRGRSPGAILRRHCSTSRRSVGTELCRQIQ